MLEYYPISEFIREPDEVRIEALRANILYMITRAGSGHLGSACSALRTVYNLYVQEMQPDDLFISSKGHDCAAQYAVLMMLGLIPEWEIHRFRTVHGLPGHPHPSVPGVVTHTGSLGMGLSKAQGIALADRLAGRKRRIFVMVGDGELQEGQNWEALRNIAARKLDITVIVDRNGYQCDRGIEETIGADWPDRLDGMMRVSKDPKSAGLPWEGTNRYHAGAPTPIEYKQALDAIKARIPHLKTQPGPARPSSGYPELANALREAWGRALSEVMAAADEVVCLDADLSGDCGLEGVRRSFPDRFFEFGISEQDMVSAAGGMALSGLVPVVHSFASFLCRRANEQIYNNACEGTTVIYVGHLAGLLPPGPGPTHECLDDVALMRTIPGMLILEPDGFIDMRNALWYASRRHKGPAYIRIPCLRQLEGMRR